MNRHSAISVFGIVIVVAALIFAAKPYSTESVHGATDDSRLRQESDPPAVSDVGHPTFVSPHASPIAMGSGNVFVVNTPSDTVDVIDSTTREITSRINVGIDPASIAVRPDGKEVWVSNHISDSVSVIDNDPSSSFGRSH